MTGTFRQGIAVAGKLRSQAGRFLQRILYDITNWLVCVRCPSKAQQHIFSGGGMRTVKCGTRVIPILAVAFCLPSHASTLKTLYSISGSSDGSHPSAALIDVSGVLYGTTTQGGANGYGAIFKIDSVSGVETPVYSFQGSSDGANPIASLEDVNGVLFGTTSHGGNYNDGTVFTFDPSTGTETTIHVFSGGDGSNPGSGLLDVNGTLYGTTQLGGFADDGTVYTISPTTGTEKVLYSFRNGSDGAAPAGNLIAMDGFLYGTSNGGGQPGWGTVFKIDREAGTETIVYALTGSDGGEPVGLVSVSGQLYVTATESGGGEGAILKVDPTTGNEMLLHQFNGNTDGATPNAALIDVSGSLYGTTTGGGSANSGTVFSIDPGTGTEAIVYSFSGLGDGSSPDASLIDLKGNLFGTTLNGGNSAGGTVFKVDDGTNEEETLHSFAAVAGSRSAAGLSAAHGTVFVTSEQGGPVNQGSITEVNIKTGVSQNVDSFSMYDDGSGPTAALTKVGSTYFGVTAYGGSAGMGTVYSFNPATKSETILHSFSGGDDGQYPSAPLLYVNGALFGTTYVGGAGMAGTIFKIDPTTGVESVVHAFPTGANDGLYPESGLINVKGILYGTTNAAAGAYGTIYSFDPIKGVETSVYIFTSITNGAEPSAGLLNISGLLYGTTAGGGKRDGGTVFKFNPANSQETVLHSFTYGTDGGYPVSALIPVNGVLYGSTSSGGSSGDGVVFSMDRMTGAESVLYAFTNGADGGHPDATLISIGNLLYGATSSGGAANLGTVFSLQP